MPGLDGFGVLEERRNDSQAAAIPVILLTARADNESLQRGLELGANDYLSKPFQFDEMLTVIRAHLGD